MMKMPPHNMTEYNLVQWIYDNDFSYWAELYLEDVRCDQIRLKELFDDEVYDMIDDEVRYGEAYEKYVRQEDDE